MPLRTVLLACLALAIPASEPAWASGPVAEDGSATVATVFEIAGGRITLAAPAASSDAWRDAIAAWTAGAARAVAGLYGGFPVAVATVTVRSGPGGGIHHGHTTAGRDITIQVGAEASVADLTEDWILPHEMIHLAFPDLDRPHLWMEEGAASYFEPIARARLGLLPAAEVWRSILHGAPQGQPAAGDQGLDRTPTWGRTYWGGLLFWLQADVDIRARSGGRHSAIDALRALRAAGATGATHWDIADVLRTGDRAVGLDVLEALYRTHAEHAVPFDLDGLWRRLGVSLRDGSVILDDAAPDAALRRALTAPQQGDERLRLPPPR